MMEKAGPKSRLIIILSFIFLISLIILFFVQSAPSKFFANNHQAGIGLVRDDKELGVFYERIGYFLHHGTPYQYAPIEYPPVAIAYLTIPAIFFKTFESYRTGLVALNLLTALVMFCVTYSLLSKLGRDRNILWLFALPSFVYFIVNRFDILPALLTQVALLLLFKKRFGWSFFVLSLLFLTKGYALVLFPVFFLYYINQKQIPKPNLIKNKPLAIFIVPIVSVTAVVCSVAGFVNGLFPYVFQSSRFFGVGTIYAPYYLAIQSLVPTGLFNVGANIFAKAFSGLQLIVPVLVYIGYSIFRKFIVTKEEVAQSAIIILMLYVLISVYYSPQWFVWLLPLLLLIIKDRMSILLIIFYDIFNYLQFPVFWHYLGPYTAAFNMIVIARTILFVWLLAVLFAKTTRFGQTPGLSFRKST